MYVCRNYFGPTTARVRGAGRPTVTACFTRLRGRRTAFIIHHLGVQVDITHSLFRICLMQAMHAIAQVSPHARPSRADRDDPPQVGPCFRIPAHPARRCTGLSTHQHTKPGLRPASHNTFKLAGRRATRKEVAANASTCRTGRTDPPLTRAVLGAARACTTCTAKGVCRIEPTSVDGSSERTSCVGCYIDKWEYVCHRLQSVRAKGSNYRTQWAIIAACPRQRIHKKVLCCHRCITWWGRWCDRGRHLGESSP